MGQREKLQQQWEFRRRGSQFDSSDNEAVSNSSDEPLIKKHRLISDWIPPKINEVGSFSGFQPKGRYTSGTAIHFKSEKANKMRTGSSKKGDDPVYREAKGRPSYEEDDCKNNCDVQDDATLNDTRILMKSILEELKVARENLFVWMREEMHKVMVDDDDAPVPNARAGNHQQEMIKEQSLKSFESESDVQYYSGKALMGSVKRKRTVKPHKGHQVPEDQDFHKAIGSVDAIKTKRERFTSSAEGILILSGSSDQDGYKNSALEHAMPETCVENQRFESSSCNYSQPRVIGDKIATNTGNASETPLNSSMQPRGLLGFQQEDFGHFVHIDSQDFGYIDQNKLNLASRFGAGFPIPLHHDLDGAFKTDAQPMQTPSHVHNDISDMSMNGGSMRNHGVSGLCMHNNLRSHLNCDADADALTQGYLVPRSQREFGYT
ncbi:PREDICTED: uncharacterized protein LOC104596042 [Nelumbo nucifera]|uniref:Uncharacterized protein LOC104596042 n=1 Tax=Nelumbo nucifera TaxID=4432 RepID=A0A1U7ZTB8_NELNU|nr:PREDICTED: uncharacterized protein LOC104596042 [Nelumbo nucifera]